MEEGESSGRNDVVCFLSGLGGGRPRSGGDGGEESRVSERIEGWRTVRRDGMGCDVVSCCGVLREGTILKGGSDVFAMKNED